MAPQLVVGAIMVDDLAAPTRVLAARRTRPIPLAGRWEFPGGKVEPGEQPTEALVRELAEELSTQVTLGPELTQPGDRPWMILPEVELRLWFAVPLTPVLPGGDHDRLRWLTEPELHDVDWLDTDREVVALLAPQLLVPLC